MSDYELNFTQFQREERNVGQFFNLTLSIDPILLACKAETEPINRVFYGIFFVHLLFKYRI